MEIQIKTEQKISVFEIKKFEEEIDIDILNKLIQSDLLQTVKWTVGTIEFENEKHRLLMLRKLI